MRRQLGGGGKGFFGRLVRQLGAALRALRGSCHLTQHLCARGWRAGCEAWEVPSGRVSLPRTVPSMQYPAICPPLVPGPCSHAGCHPSAAAAAAAAPLLPPLPPIRGPHAACRTLQAPRMPTTRVATRRMSGVADPLQALGQDLLCLAFSSLPPADLLACALVCRGWRGLLAGTHGDSLWQAHCEVQRGARGSNLHLCRFACPQAGWQLKHHFLCLHLSCMRLPMQADWKEQVYVPAAQRTELPWKRRYLLALAGSRRTELTREAGAVAGQGAV